MELNTVYLGDCLEVMGGLGDDSVDAIVTDPPYGLSFMGKKWDYDVPSVAVFEQMHRVLKDGGRLLCFAGSRTFHRMWVNIEDAGFTIEDTIAWMYGSGFPKHGSKLKPAYEPVCVARKGKVSLLNIDAARIGIDESETGGKDFSAKPASNHVCHSDMPSIYANGAERRTVARPHPQSARHDALGRWPANVVLDDVAAGLLDEQSDGLHARGNLTAATSFTSPNAVTPFQGSKRGVVVNHGDSGGASRFFYCAKADSTERNAGLDDHEAKIKSADYRQPTGNAMVDRVHGCGNPARNSHPTVKPVSLMRWLVRLVAKPGELVLDPFAGSGTTLCAAAVEQCKYIGIEREPEYAALAQARAEYWAAHPPELAAKAVPKNQATLELEFAA